MSSHTIEHVADGVHTARAPQGFFGLELGARMTLLETDAGLLVHSPIAIDPAAVLPVGTPRWVLAPNLFHHLYVGPWLDADIEGWAAPGIVKKRDDVTFHGTVESDIQPFGDDIRVLPISCLPISNEVVVLHRPSRTLVVTDLVFNLSASAPWLTRLAMRALWAYPGCCTSLLERVAMKRDAARRDLTEILSWDFDRVIMSHGEVIETGGKDAVAGAFGWLFRGRELPARD